jgi:hypothetical protein
MDLHSTDHLSCEYFLISANNHVINYISIRIIPVSVDYLTTIQEATLQISSPYPTQLMVVRELSLTSLLMMCIRG